MIEISCLNLLTFRTLLLLIVFTALTVFVDLLTALQTLPYVPCPNFLGSTSYESVRGPAKERINPSRLNFHGAPSAAPCVEECSAGLATFCVERLDAEQSACVPSEAGALPQVRALREAEDFKWAAPQQERGESAAV